MKFKIEFTNNPTELQKNIVKEYWEYENYDFKSKPTEMASREAITVPKLISLVQNHSFCLISFGDCSKCGIDIEKKVRTQTEFREKVSRYNIFCDHHREEFFQKAKDDGKQIVHAKMKAAYDYKVWEILNQEELQFFESIIRIGSKKLIFQKLFENDKEADKIRWLMLDKIEQLGLLRIKRSETNSIEKFIFHSSLKNLFVGAKLDSENDAIQLRKVEKSNMGNLEVQFSNANESLGFVLKKNRSKTLNRHPTHTVRRRFDENIRIEKGKEYLISAWVSDVDNSISVNVKAYNSFKESNEVKDTNPKPAFVKYAEPKDPEPPNTLLNDDIDTFDETPF